jgi:hypothetical protein
MAKVEVQVRSCFCCGLSLSSALIGIYTLILYTLLTILAIWALANTAWQNDEQLYSNCESEAEGKINADNHKITFTAGHTVVIVKDSTTYHCSFGLYTEELKFSAPVRYTLHLFNLILWALLIPASILLLIGVCAYFEWLLIPWMLLMVVDIVRGFISTVFIAIYSYGNLARWATAIFFLGLMLFHWSMLILIIAKFQRIHNRRKGIPVDGNRPYDPRYGPVYGSNAAPPSSYGYSSQQPAYQGGYPVDYPASQQPPYGHQRY